MSHHTKPALLWLQSITCNGNAHSFFNHPDLFAILSSFDLVYHPLIDTQYAIEDLIEGSIPCDILIIEGAYRKEGWQRGEVEVSKLIEIYGQKASFVITVGTCATFGGIFKEADPTHISGVAFDKEKPAHLYDRLRSKLICLPGCPIHPEWLGFVLRMIAAGRAIAVDRRHRPRELYGYTVHAGCTRNEYFEWKVDAQRFGEKEGCLFYELGCQGPFTRGSCNKILWHDVSSKTRAGTPCFGCTEPTFPKRSLHHTSTRMGIPENLPLGIPRRAYLTLAGVAKSFTIKRFGVRLMEYEQ